MPYVFTSAIGVSESSEIIDIKGKQNSNGISQTPQVFIDCQVADDEEGLKVNWFSTIMKVSL